MLPDTGIARLDFSASLRYILSPASRFSELRISTHPPRCLSKHGWHELVYDAAVEADESQELTYVDIDTFLASF